MRRTEDLKETRRTQRSSRGGESCAILDVPRDANEHSAFEAVRHVLSDELCYQRWNDLVRGSHPPSLFHQSIEFGSRQGHPSPDTPPTRQEVDQRLHLSRVGSNELSGHVPMTDDHESETPVIVVYGKSVEPDEDVIARGEDALEVAKRYDAVVEEYYWDGVDPDTDTSMGGRIAVLDSDLPEDVHREIVDASIAGTDGK